MVPMTQYSLTQLENMARSQGNEIALELIRRFDDCYDGQHGKPSEVPSFYDLENDKCDRYEEGFADGEEEGIEKGREDSKNEILEKAENYLRSLDFTEENIRTFLQEIQ